MSDSAALTFSHREAVLLTNASDEALHSWVKRGYVSPAIASTGRGKRRAYDQMNLVQISVLRTLSRAGIDPSLGSLVFEQLRPLAADLIARFANEPVPSNAVEGNSAGPLDRPYRTWLIDSLGIVRAEFTHGENGTVVSNTPLDKLPITAMWLSVDVLVNEWVMSPIEYVQAGRVDKTDGFFECTGDRIEEFDQMSEADKT